MKYKIVIFDMGNTLLDFHAGEHSDEEKDVIGCNNMSSYLKEKYSIEVSAKSIKSELIDIWYSDFYKRQYLIELDVCMYVNQFLRSIGCENENVDCKELMRNFYRPYMDEVVVNEGALESLKSIRKSMKVGVISNCILFDELYEETFENTGLSKYIDKFIFSYSRQIRKPDNRLFEEMLNHFGFMPDEAIMVGDSYKADILPANLMGMKTIHLTDKHYNESVADISIRSLKEVVFSLERL